MEQVRAATRAPLCRTPDVLERLLFVLAVAALALSPTQLTFAVQKFPVHLAEPLLLLAALAWGVRLLGGRGTETLPPRAHWLLVGAAALGVFIPGDALQFGVVKDVLKMALYLLVAFTVFRAVFASPARLRVAVYALLATTTLAVAFAVVQRVLLEYQFQPDPARRLVFADSKARLDDDEAARMTAPAVMGMWEGRTHTPCSFWRALVTVQTPGAVSSTFGSWDRHGYHPSRTAYAGFLALVLPFALALLLAGRVRRGVALWLVLLLLGAAVSVLAGFLLPALLLGLLVTGCALGPRAARLTAGGLLAYLLLAALVGGHTREEMLREPFQPRISVREAAFRYEDGVRHVKKFWGEQQAALNVIRAQPLFGVGAGNYQEAIGLAYDRLGSVEQQRLDADAQNGYLLTAVTTGILGLAALLLLLGNYLGTARHALRAAPGDPWRAALLGALVALVTMMLVTNPWVRGTMMAIAALLAAISANATETSGERIEK